jgi:hypothetical protein
LHGYRLLRFLKHEALGNLDGVSNEIQGVWTPTLTPARKGEGERAVSYPSAPDQAGAAGRHWLNCPAEGGMDPPKYFKIGEARAGRGGRNIDGGRA